MYACADAARADGGGYVAVGCIEPPFYRSLLRGLGFADGAALPAALAEQYDARRWPRAARLLADAFAARPRDAWAATFRGGDACVTPVLTLGELARGDAARELTRDDGAGAREPAPAPRLLGTPARGPGRGPEHGAHTEAALREAGVDARCSRASSPGRGRGADPWFFSR